MRFDKFRLVGNNSIDLPVVGEVGEGPFVLKGADGLDSVERTVRFAKGAGTRRVYQGKSVAPRQIVLRIGLHPNWDEGQPVEELRRMLYRLLTPRNDNLVRFEIIDSGWVPPTVPTTTVRAMIGGHISRMENVIFSKDPEVQITIDCDDSYFRGPYPVPGMPVKNLNGDPGGQNCTVDLYSYGTAPTPFWLRFKLDTGHAIQLQLTFGRQLIRVDGVTFGVNDTFTVDNHPGRRGLWKTTAAGVTTSLLNNRHDASSWLEIYEGWNAISVNNRNVSFVEPKAYEYTPLDEGV